ncbi:alpha-2-macroglobulin family protein [Mesoflavibacter zeaxanthinifaciens]|uniref:alpha-2-macroglobulin family protein n=1 Tax=Mesoflavibacter zeaxanthinifaciens TaxID=393060 RepID=UPI00040EB0DF|nr:alpha-2-macroglobulin family protein [Mesoflavibacter zeaxanthinifaciens]
MKQISTLIMILLFATTYAQDDYSKLWKQVKTHEKDGLPKSALDVVKQIEILAKKEQNSPQVIKTLIFKSKYTLTLEEDAQLSIIRDFKTEINNSQSPTKNVLQNLLANLYWQYFNQNRYKFYNRTKTESKVDDEDFRTWDLNTLFTEIQTLFNQSLENESVLKSTSIHQFDAIINKAKNSETYRPTLFDILSHNALDFFKTDENSITKPAYKFEIDNATYLSTSSKFSTLKLEAKDSTSLQLQALKVYQKLIQFHQQNKNYKALVDVNIQRLDYVLQHATFNNKDEIYLQTLKDEIFSIKTDETAALYEFEIAEKTYQNGLQYDSKTSTENRWLIQEALAIVNNIIKRFPDSKAAKNSTILKQQILNKELQITTETYIPIQQNSRFLVRYKNVENLEFTLYNLSKNQLETYNKTYREDERLKFIKTLKQHTNWNNNLKNENDYQSHTTEVVVPKLSNGSYLILARANSDLYATQTFQITDFALTEMETNNEVIFQLIDRNNGQPIQNATLDITYRKNYKNKYHNSTLKTDVFGKATLKKASTYLSDVSAEVNHNNQTAYFGNYYVGRTYDNTNKEETRYNTFVFTDRSIYRPSQTVYFKAIAIKTFKQKSEVLQNEAVYAILYNVNNEEVGRLELKTNDFGSVAGEFILPNSGLNGRYKIQILGKNHTFDNGRHYFSVEEYKRPKFEANFNPITETFKINDSITIKGNAKAYAGSNISDTKVTYTVKRKVQYPTWWYWRRPYFNSEPQEITHGETTTNDKGEFDITFKAIPDQSVDQKSQPIFNYEVTADITDINGETRSATTIVNVGYHALTATMSVKSELDKTNKAHAIQIDTKNLNGEFVSAKGTIKIYKLKAPNQVLRKRPWDAPDYHNLSETEFKNLFPHDAYNNEDDSQFWDKGKILLTKEFNTENTKDVKLGNIRKWDSGKYLIVLESKDKFGQLVKDETRTTLYSEKDNTVSDNQLFTITTNKDSYQPNDTAVITFGSAATNLTVFIDVEKDNRIINSNKYVINNEKKTIRIPVTDKDLGGFAVHYSFAAFNSYTANTLAISVPYPKTDLEIETTTFRDKIQPGTDETWSFKIKGPKGEKISAELLASMYDASLDQFKSHSWEFNPLYQPTYNPNHNKNNGNSFGQRGFRVINNNKNYYNYPTQQYDQINWFGLSFGNNYRYDALQGRAAGVSVPAPESIEVVEDEEEVIVSDISVVSSNESDYKNSNLDTAYYIPNEALKLKDKKEYYFLMKKGKIIDKQEIDFSTVTIRKNLQETAFFFPQLQTDKDGNVSFNFTTPETLTKWKLQLLAHTKTLKSSVSTLETVTQKELMVIPNAPRFLRQGDQITISTKIANLSDKALSGQAKLILTDAVSAEDITSLLVSSNSVENFTIDKDNNTQVSWQLSITDTVNAVQYKIVAKAGDFSDGEQNALPVLTNRMLVTETLPMWIRSNQTRTFTLDKLKNTSSSTLKHHKLTLEMTSNPAWYAVQALPYLMEYPYDCNEQTFSRYYANALASHIANSNPRIQEVFNQWKNTDALISNLEKNQELKSILIQETPWLRDAQSETEQKKRIALLFDLNKMNNELQNAKNKLKQNQMSNGAWAWFNGGRPNRFITQHIITGFGHLKQLNVIQSDSEESMIKKAIQYLDSEFVEEYNNLTKYNKDVDLSKDHLSHMQIHYLYMRSFFPEIKTSKEVKTIMDYYQSQIQNYWLNRSLYNKGLMALISYRNNDTNTTSKILNSLKETSITSEELGMYWKSNENSWYWYQAPIETQALLIETFSEAGNVIQNETKNLETIDNLKIWLLKNKQTNRWKTTKATTEAVYALLLQGSDWLSVTDMVDIVLGNQKIDPNTMEDVKVEAGTGYFKTSWSANEISSKMAEVKISKKGEGIAWGSLYWQYFEDLDKITSAKTPLQLKKKLFLKTNTDTGETLTEINKETKLKVGDLVTVRIELRSDRNMEFIHMKDMRAAGLEPTNVISQYKWQDGLGFYQSTKDASTNFFFDYLPKGVYVFEYDLRVNNAGNMSNGITTIQSMYAPEFSSHSEGVRIDVE